MAHNLLMVGEDGNVYSVDSGELGKIAKKVDKSSLSDDVQSHVNQVVGSGSGSSTHIIASKADIITSSKADIIVQSSADIIVQSSADIIVES